jgi:hypothetical protein
MENKRYGFDLSESLRMAIRQSGLNPNQLQNATGVLSDTIARFLREEQSLRLEAADKLAAFLGVRVVIPDRTERRPTVLQAKDYINAVIEAWNVEFPKATIPPTGGHFVTLRKFCDGEKIQSLFKRRGNVPEIQVGVVLDSSSAAQNQQAAKAYRERLSADIEAGRIENVPTASGNNVGLLHRIPITADTPLGDLAKQVIAEARHILSRLGKI